jgi:ABC-2 type transport system permease protein
LGALPVSVLAIWFFDYSIYGLGLPLVGFFCNLLVMGWATGLAVSGLVLRHGQGAESLAWVSIFAISPITGIWYPIAVLPDWLQPVAWALPSAHVFEGMRAIMIHGAYRADLMLSASLINLIYIAIGAAIFLNYFRLARRDGQLLQMGE